MSTYILIHLGIEALEGPQLAYLAPFSEAEVKLLHHMNPKALKKNFIIKNLIKLYQFRYLL